MTSVGTLTCDSSELTSISPLASRLRTASAGEVETRCSSLNQSACSLVAVRNELRCEHLSECRILLTPAEAHQGEHRLAGFLLRLGPGAFLPADGIASEKNQMRNALRMSDRVGDRNRAALRYAEQRETVDAGGVDHRFEVVHESLEDRRRAPRDPIVRCRGRRIGTRYDRVTVLDRDAARSGFQNRIRDGSSSCRS